MTNKTFVNIKHFYEREGKQEKKPMHFIRECQNWKLSRIRRNKQKIIFFYLIHHTNKQLYASNDIA